MRHGCLHGFCSCFVFFPGFLKIIAPGVVFRTILLPQGSGFRTFFVPRGGGGGEFALSKQFLRGLPGGGGW